MPKLFNVQPLLINSDTGFGYPEERHKCQLQEWPKRAMLNQHEISISFAHAEECDIPFN